MKKYKVHVSWECQGYYYVDAENFVEAEKLADEMEGFPDDYEISMFTVNYAEEV